MTIGPAPMIRMDLMSHSARRTDDLGEVHAREAGEGARLGHGSLGVERLPRRIRCSRLRTLLAQHAGQLAGVDAGDRDDLLARR
jgi:hypothetical protein